MLTTDSYKEMIENYMDDVCRNKISMQGMKQIDKKAELLLKEQINDLIKQAEASGFEKQEGMFENEEYLICYVGSVFSIYPSGKYYLPFACSNVDECSYCNHFKDVCHVCNGHGSIDAKLDMWFNEIVDEVENYWMEGGEGDPTDIFVCKMPETITAQ